MDSVRLKRVLVRSGFKVANLDSTKLDWFELSPDEKSILFEFSQDLFLYNLDSEMVSQITHFQGIEELAEFSPDGSMISFVRDHDLYVVDLQSGHESRLTLDGSEKILNGKLDWLYQEEIYGRGNRKSYWWSPNSSHLAYLQLDESLVPWFTLVDQNRTHQTLERIRYPKAGDANPGVRVGVVRARGGDTQWIEGASKTPHHLVVRVSWDRDGSAIFFQVQDRRQTWLAAKSYQIISGKATTLFLERTGAWVNVLGEPHWLADGSFLWLSERSGWRHLYHYSADGSHVATVTSGDWNVSRLLHYGDTAEKIYFTADRDGSTQRHLYRSNLTGGEVVRVSTNPGTHRPKLNRQGSLYLDTWSDINTPPRVSVHRVDGTMLRTIHPRGPELLKDFQLSTPEFFQVPTRDGFLMEVMMIRPHDFDPNRKYPVLFYVYGGPGISRVRKRWNGTDHLWHQFLAQEGYLIWMCDNRSASGKGAGSAWSVHHNLGYQELQDLEDSLQWLKRHSYVDKDRIGIWGWSFGGYLTSYAMTHSTSFRMGIAGAPVTDWSLYDTVYTERYMGLPSDNLEGYRRSSVLEAAGNLYGKLLLIHGAMDGNVHIQNSLRLADRLQGKGKNFQMMIYPQSGHGVRNPARIQHLRQLMTRFILENL